MESEPLPLHPTRRPAPRASGVGIRVRGRPLSSGWAGAWGRGRGRVKGRPVGQVREVGLAQPTSHLSPLTSHLSPLTVTVTVTLTVTVTVTVTLST